LSSFATAASRSSEASPRSPPSQPGSIAAAVAAETSTSPEPASDSRRIVSLAAGPVTISSRCDVPATKTWQVPEWTPVDMRSETGPTELFDGAAFSMNHCI
jgi:hypothetical protein